jgi:outer membrane protein assembly factor BamB
MAHGIRKIAKGLGLAVVALVVAGAVLYLFGFRIVIYGGGKPHLAFVESESARAERLAKHREAQRAIPDAAPEPAAPRATEPRTAAPASPEPAAAPPVTSVASGAAPSATPTEPAPYWTDFRGPRRDGHYTERPILTNWPAGGLKPMWRQPVGGGYGSFTIARGRAFTIEQRGGEEVASAYDVATGRERWTSRWTAEFREILGGNGPRATPTWADGLVYVQGATGELRCLEDATGRLVWRTNILADAGAANLQWGMAVSPLVVDDTVVVLPGGANGQSVVAYDRRTGKRAWSALGDRQAYSSPMLVTIAGVRQILVFAASRLVGISPDRGTVLWEYPWKTQHDINAG